MTIIPAGIAAEAALTRQNVALSVIKQSAEQDKAIASILDQAVENTSSNSGRGQNVNILA